MREPDSVGLRPRLLTLRPSGARERLEKNVFALKTPYAGGGRHKEKSKTPGVEPGRDRKRAGKMPAVPGGKDRTPGAAGWEA